MNNAFGSPVCVSDVTSGVAELLANPSVDDATSSEVLILVNIIQYFVARIMIR